MWVRPQDSVVLISSRPVGCSTDPDRLATGLHAMEYTPTGEHGGRAWRETDWQSIVSHHDPGVPTIVFVHGNRLSWPETRSRGLYMYKRLVRTACDDRPIRFLMWSWCADRIHGELRDYREKAARTGPVGKQLAWVINQIPAEEQLGFIGYSYGARITSHALHELGSGRLGGPSRQVRAVYVAAAMDSHWLGHGQRNGHAMDVTEQLLATTNCKDPAMRFYHLLPKNYHPDALGDSGPTCLSRDRACRVRLVDVKHSVGVSHDLCDYVRAPGLMAKAYRLLSYQDAYSQSAQTVAVGGLSEAE